MNTRKCHCRRAEVGPYAMPQCYLCWLPLNDPRYAAWADGYEPEKVVAEQDTSLLGGAERAPCKYLGQRLEVCPCGNSGKDVYECEKYDQMCVQINIRVKPGVRTCATCDGYELAHPDAAQPRTI